MSDLVACPTCRATLRLPPGAATVRCPQCKSTLQVLDGSDPAPPAPPPPPPKPLPFAPQVGRPKSPPAPASKAKAKASKKKHRPEVVDEELEAEQRKAEEKKAERERRRKLRKELKEFERQEMDEEDRYDEIDEQCEWGRRALTTLKWSLLGYLFALVVGYMILIPLTAIGWLFNDRLFMAGLGGFIGGFGLVVSVGASLGLAVAFVLALRGPLEARPTAVIGLVVTGLHLLTHCLCGVQVFAAVATHAAGNTADVGYPGMWLAYALLGTGSNLQVVGDGLVRFGFRFASPEYLLPNPWWVVNVADGILEFTRLLLVCQLAQRYAELGKSDRIAADSPKTVSRVFITLLVFTLFRAAACFGFDWFTDGTMMFIGKLIHVTLFVVPFLIIGVRLLTQFRAIGETEDVLIADRVASGFDRMDEV